MKKHKNLSKVVNKNNIKATATTCFSTYFKINIKMDSNSQTENLMKTKLRLFNHRRQQQIKAKKHNNLSKSIMFQMFHGASWSISSL
jgi:hypothetical protein